MARIARHAFVLSLETTNTAVRACRARIRGNDRPGPFAVAIITRGTWLRAHTVGAVRADRASVALACHDLAHVCAVGTRTFCSRAFWTVVANRADAIFGLCFRRSGDAKVSSRAIIDRLRAVG